MMKGLTKTFSTKLIGLMVGLLLGSLFVFYNFTKPAYEAWHQLQTLEVGTKKMPRVSRDELEIMHSYIRKNTFGGKEAELQQSLFYSLSSLCDTLQLSLHDFSMQRDGANDSAVKIITSKVTVEGDFKSIVRMLHLIEATSVGSGISSASFYIRNHPKSKARKLACDIYLQSIVNTL